MDATWKSTRGKPHVVYVLGDPRTMLPRYVGCTVNLHKRYLGHLRGQSGTKVKRWVKELCSLGLKPLVLPIQQTARAYEGENAEQKWIAYFWRRDRTLLFNSVNNAQRDERITAMWAHRRRRKEAFKDRCRIRRESKRILSGVREPKPGKPRRPRMFTLNGETLHMSAWAKRCGVSRERIRQRLLKYPPETAIGAYLTAEVPS